MSVRAVPLSFLAMLLLAGAGGSARAEPAGHITGVGGVFIKAKDPKALAAWYRDVLGLPVQAWGGAALHEDPARRPPAVAWSAFAASSTYFAPSGSTFMIDYSVDDLDALLARVRAKGVDVLKQVDDDANGRFAWIIDPEGNKVELWEPKRTTPP